MEGELKKIVYSDNGQDKAIAGHIVNEDEFFFTVIDRKGIELKIGKRAIICIKDLGVVQ